MLPHPDDLGRVHETHVRGKLVRVRRRLALEARNITGEDDLVGAVLRVVDCAANDLARGVVASHRVDRDAHLG